MVHENSTHHLRGNAEKMRSTLPVRLLIDEAEIGFIDKARSLEGVAGPFTPHVAPG
jgi:hypothetical protein